MKKFIPVLLLCTALGLPQASGVIIYGGDGTANTTAPADFSEFNNVGVLNWPSCVYLGSYSTGNWVISALHVWGTGSSTSVTLGGNSYDIVAGSMVQIGGADLIMFRISDDPGLANLSIASSTLTTGTNVRMAGNGKTRAANLSYWNVSGTSENYTWNPLPNATGANEWGYSYGGANVMRWGTATAGGTGLINEIAPTEVFATVFAATTGSAQGSPGDSGGGVFIQNGDHWELAGIMAYIAGYPNQPGDTAIPGNQTYAVDLTTYRADIMALIPEANTVVPVILFGGITAGIGLALRRKKI